ncbi:MAG: hypothetical protein AB8B73_04405 [Ekhidna sp.]
MSINSINLPGTVFGSALNKDNQLLLDVRDEKKQTITYYQLDLHSLSLVKLPFANAEWWTKLVSADSEALYFTKYKDRSDPNSKAFFKAVLGGKQAVEVDETPLSNTEVKYPTLYEVETPHHQTVSDFLGLDLPLSCEYEEWENKIIISYYLRSDNAFDRFLLLLDNGKKEWKLHQDRRMKGFSPGAFFIHQNQLIFFKELNEVCTYPL